MIIISYMNYKTLRISLLCTNILTLCSLVYMWYVYIYDNIQLQSCKGYNINIDNKPIGTIDNMFNITGNIIFLVIGSLFTLSSSIYCIYYIFSEDDYFDSDTMLAVTSHGNILWTILILSFINLFFIISFIYPIVITQSTHMNKGWFMDKNLNNIKLLPKCNGIYNIYDGFYNSTSCEYVMDKDIYVFSMCCAKKKLNGKHTNLNFI